MIQYISYVYEYSLLICISSPRSQGHEPLFFERCCVYIYKRPLPNFLKLNLARKQAEWPGNDVPVNN